MNLLIATFLTICLVCSAAIAQTDTVELLQLNSAGLKRIDLVYRSTRTDDDNAGKISTSQDYYRWIFDEKKQIAVWLSVIDVRGTKKFGATRIQGSELESRDWPRKPYKVTVANFHEALAKARLITIDFIGLESFPFPAVVSAFGKEKQNAYSNAKEIWNQEISWWSQATVDENDGRSTTYVRPPNQQGLIAELSVDNQTLLPDRRSVFRISKKNPGERIRFFNETYRWTRLNQVIVPVSVSYDTRHNALDENDSKVMIYRTVDTDFKWVSVNAAIDMNIIESDLFSDPNTIVNLTNFDEVKQLSE